MMQTSPAPESRVKRVSAALRRHTELAGEIRSAVDSGGVIDRGRWSLAIFGAVAFAWRVGCRPVEVRMIVRHFVSETLTESHDPATLERCADAAAAVVDALYLAVGDELPGADGLGLGMPTE